jgi:hypothetical protein
MFLVIYVTSSSEGKKMILLNQQYKRVNYTIPGVNRKFVLPAVY